MATVVPETSEPVAGWSLWSQGHQSLWLMVTVVPETSEPVVRWSLWSLRHRSLWLMVTVSQRHQKSLLGVTGECCKLRIHENPHWVLSLLSVKTYSE